MERNEEDHGAKLVRYILSVLLGGVAALVVCFVFLMVASLGVWKGFLGEDIMYQITVVSCVLGSFIGAMVAIRRCGERALIVGLLVGVVLFLIQLTIGMLFFTDASLEFGGMGLLCGGLCGGAAAGILRGKPKKKRRK